MRPQLRLMIERKRLVREGTPEAEEKAEMILKKVERSGGLTPEEILTLQVY